MTVFQSFDWYSVVNSHFLMERWSRRAVRARYYMAVDDAGDPVLIAPMRFHLATLSKGHRKGVHLLGRNGPADYLNLIYRDFDPVVAASILTRACEDAREGRLHLERLPTSTASFRWLSSIDSSQVEQHDAVQLVLPDSVAAYQSLLSKSTRQNLRTARNRAERDGLKLSFVTSDKVEESEAIRLRDLKRRRDSARRSRAGESTSRRMVGKVRDAYFGWLFGDFDEAYVSMMSFNRVWILNVLANASPCAFAYGLADKQNGRRVLRILQVAIDESYAQYSPGMLGLHDFITTEIGGTDRSFDVVDFTRGGERYKYDLGGVEHGYADVRLSWPCES